jgi:hypothetical protein
MTDLLALAVCFMLAALALLVVRMRTELRQASMMLRRTIELMPVVETDDDHGHGSWPGGAAIQAGVPAPPELVASADGMWTVAVLVAGRDDLSVLVPDSEELARVTSRYRLVVGSPASHKLESVDGLPAVGLPEPILDALPLPVAVMIDPGGIVQGVGSLADRNGLAAFVHEGELHGFGPVAQAHH